MCRTYKNPRRPNIISMRVTDEELALIRSFSQLEDKRATEIMREALQLFVTQLAESNPALAAY